MTPNPDPLTPLDYDRIWDDGRDIGFEDGLAAGRRLQPYQVAVCILAGAILGSLATIVFAQITAAAPRPAHLSTIPVVDDGRTGAPPQHKESDISGQPGYLTPTPTAVTGGAPQSQGGGVVGDTNLTTGRPRSPEVAAAAPLSGIASWYPARGLIAAAGPGLRQGRWRGSHLVVSANGRSVTVELADWCACPHGRLIDLSDDAFALLAPLSRGLVRVTVAGMGPEPTLPATDRNTP